MLTACGSSDSNEKSNSNNNSSSSKQSSESKIQIVSSIKPIQAIVLAITGEHADTNQIIPEYASPHNYSFKPSDIRKVKSADVIFRIDEHMETQLNGVFEGLDKNTKIVSLAEVEGIKLLESADSHDDHESESIEHEEAHEEHDEEDKDSHEGHGNIDFHIWTSPKNAIHMANEITKTVSLVDPENKQYYQKNLKAFSEAALKELEKTESRLAKYKDNGYVVFHNSWQYLAVELGLQKPNVVDLHEGVSKGAKTVIDIRTKIKEDNIRCIFYDASVNEARIKLLTEDAKIHTEEIDVLTKGIEMNQSTYINWLQVLSNQIESCLSS